MRKRVKKDKMWSVLLSNIRFLWFLQSMFLLSYLYQWCGFSWQRLKPMQKSVTTVCLHCSFARLKNKHIGVLGTNVATISWLHWSPVSGYNPSLVYLHIHTSAYTVCSVMRCWLVVVDLIACLKSLLSLMLVMWIRPSTRYTFNPLYLDEDVLVFCCSRKDIKKHPLWLEQPYLIYNKSPNAESTRAVRYKWCLALFTALRYVHKADIPHFDWLLRDWSSHFLARGLVTSQFSKKKNRYLSTLQGFHFVSRSIIRYALWIRIILNRTATTISIQQWPTGDTFVAWTPNMRRATSALLNFSLPTAFLDTNIRWHCTCYIYGPLLTNKYSVVFWIRCLHRKRHIALYLLG